MALALLWAANPFDWSCLCVLARQRPGTTVFEVCVSQPFRKYGVCMVQNLLEWRRTERQTHTHTQVSAVFCWGRHLQLSSHDSWVSNNITFLAISVKNELLIWFGWSIGSSIWFLQCCSSFRGSSSIWGARAPRVVKMASQLRILSSLAYQADSSSPFIYQTWIFCKKNGSKRSFLPEIEVQTFWYTLYAVTTACCVPWQIPREIWKNTAGKSASPTFSFSLDTTRSKAPRTKKKPSPSTLRRNARQREEFKAKKQQSSPTSTGALLPSPEKEKRPLSVTFVITKQHPNRGWKHTRGWSTRRF